MTTYVDTSVLAAYYCPESISALALDDGVERGAKTAGRAVSGAARGTLDELGLKELLIGAGVKSKDPKSLFLLPEDLSFEPYAIALPRVDAGLRLAVNSALAHIYRDGEIGPIFGKWFGPLGEPGALLQAVFIFGSLSE